VAAVLQTIAGPAVPRCGDARAGCSRWWAMPQAAHGAGVAPGADRLLQGLEGRQLAGQISSPSLPDPDRRGGARQLRGALRLSRPLGLAVWEGTFELVVPWRASEGGRRWALGLRFVRASAVRARCQAVGLALTRTTTRLAARQPARSRPGLGGRCRDRAILPRPLSRSGKVAGPQGLGPAARGGGPGRPGVSRR